MPVYQITAPNGKTYRISGPPNASQAEVAAAVMAQNPEASGKEQENMLEKIPVVGGLLAGAADIPLNVVSGLASTGKSFTDVFGAGNSASGMLDTVAKYAESLTSAQSREDEKTAAAIRKAAEGKGIWEEVKAAASSFMVNPLDTAANVVGSAIPFAAAAAAAPETGGLSLAPLALGAVSGVGTIKGSISDAVYARAKEAGVSDAQAKTMAEEAQAYDGKNLDQIALGGALGAAASATGLEGQLGRLIAKRAVKDVVEGAVEKEATRGVARRTAKGFAEEALPEAAQAGQERFSQNLAQQRAGYDTDLMAGVAGQAAFEGLAGGILGGIGGASPESQPYVAPTEEEQSAQISAAEEAIGQSELPEAQDPQIKARAAEIIRNIGGSVDEAIGIALDERDTQLARAAQTEEETNDGTDVGGGEPSVSVSDTTEAGQGLAGETTESGTGPVGVAGAPAGRSNVQEVEGADPLETVAPVAAPISIIPPIDQVSPKAQITEQLAPTGQAAPTATPAPEVAPADLKNMTQAEYAEYLKSNPNGKGVQTYNELTARPEYRGLTADERAQLFKDNEAAVRAYSKMMNDLNVDVEGITQRNASSGWEHFIFGTGTSGDSSTHKSYATLSDALALTPEDIKGYLNFVRDNGYNGQVKFPSMGSRALTSFDNIVMHGATEADAQLGSKLAQAYFGDRVTSTMQGVDANGKSHSQLLEDEVDAARSAPKAEAAPATKVETEQANPGENIAAPTPAPAIELPPEVQEAQAEVDQYNPGFEIRYNADLNPRRRYSYGLPGSKNIFYSPSLGPIKRRIIEIEKPIQPKQTVDGVPVRKVRPGDAAGTKPKPKREAPLQIERPSIAGKLSPAQEEQQSLLLAEIDAARNSLLINNAERTELVEMLRTPTGRDLARSREWTLATAIQNDINKLKDEGSALRGEEKILAKKLGRDVRLEPEVDTEGNVTEELTAEEAALAEKVANLKERTKTQNDALSKAKSGIYKRTREKLAERVDTRQKRIDQLKRNREKGFISEVVFRREMGEVRPERPMFRKGKGKANGITLEELNNAVKEITSRWGARLEPKMVQSVADLPPAIRKEIEDLNRTDSFGFYKDGKAYLIADNMNGVEDVAPTLYHEALGHLGLRERFREGLDAILDDIYRTNKGVAALADKFLSANEDLYSKDENPTARAVEEVLASASEAGPLRASRLDKLLKYIKDFARQYLGLDLKFSDREVRTILAMAHQQALSGNDTVMGSSSIMFSTPEQNEAKATVADFETKVQDAMDKVGTTTNDRRDPETFSRGMLGNIGAAISGKSMKDWLSSLGPTAVSTGFIGRGGLNALPTDGMLNYMLTKLGKNPVTDAVFAAADLVDRMNGTRATTRRLLSKTVSDLKKYLLSTNDNKLSAAMDYANYNNFDMLALKDGMTSEEAFKTDAIWRRYTKLLQNPKLSAKKKKDFTEKLVKREVEVEGARRLWDTLPKEGRDLYKRVRDMHRDMYQRRRFLIKKHIQDLKDAGMSEKTVAKMMKAYQEQQERVGDMVNAPSAEDAHVDYPEVPLGQFHKEYFPKRRYGNYWLRIKKTKFGEPVLRFYETMSDRDADWEASAKAMGVKKNDKTYFDLGNDVEMQLKDLEGVNTNTAFNKALNLISEIDTDNFSEATKTRLQNDVYQLFLLSSPEGSVRKQFIKSKNRLGWSSDILRTVGATAEEYASDVSRLAFAPQIDREIRAAKAAYESEPADKKVMSSDFVTNLEYRIQGDMQPQTQGLANKIVPWMNQLAYISFLTAPATALVQIASLPMRVAPNLWGKYGMAQTTRAMARYMNVFTNAPKLESIDTSGRKSFRILTLLESPKVKNSKRHTDALTRAANEYGIIIPLSEFTMHNERTPQTAAQGKAGEVRQKAYDAMTYMFDTTEQMTREITFMATYDLEYDKLEKAGLSAEDRQTRAIIAAKNTVNDTLGNYSNFNRPPMMKGSELAKALFLFKQYSVITTRFFVEGFRAILGKNTPREERVAAMKEMTGVLGMGFLMGGVTGMPFYTLGMMLLQAMQDAFDDDEDRKERMKKNPLTADSVEMQFRYEWIPEHFGPPTVTAEGGKQISLGDIILNGAVSEGTGWNFGSRVSLDLAGMWFRAPSDADTWSQTVNNALVENIPGASASLNIVSMGEEVAKGNVLKGLEVGLPAMIRAPIKAYSLATEGVRTKNEKIKLDSEDISNGAIIGAVLGFNPTQVAKLQKQNRDVLNRVKKLDEQKSELLNAYKQAVRRIQNGDADGQEQARAAVDDIMAYNKKIGNPYYGISYANMYKSLIGSAAEAKYDIQGMGLDKVESYYAQKLLEGK